MNAAPATSEYLPDLELTLIRQHPKNPRHKASADPELVESVKSSGVLQPVVVAPIEDDSVMQHYILIAGHRRFDASRKAKRKTIPAVVRHDLIDEGPQIEAMLIENGRRADLTPIEEAEGYAQLELLGYKAVAIAAAVGRDVKTVRTRLRLLKLSPATRKKVHAGQLTIEDAAALVDFADDPEATKRLERAAAQNDAWSWKSTLRRERSARDTNRKIAADVAKLLDAGAVQVAVPKGTSTWQLWNHDLGPTPLSRTHSEDWGQHKGCLGFVHFTGGEYSLPTLDVCCTKPSNHVEQLDESVREAIAEAERENAERAEQEAAKAIAADLRVGTLLELVGTGTAMPPALRDVVRQLLPYLIEDMSAEEEIATYQRALDIREEDRWQWVSNYRPEKPAEAVKLGQHLQEIAQYSDGNLTRALLAYMAARAEDNLTNKWRRRESHARAYLELLDEAGHGFGPVDEDLRAGLEADATKAAS